MSAALIETWPPDDQDWFDGVKALNTSIAAAEPIIEQAGESRRLNPRARWHKHDVQQDFDDLEAVGVLARHTHDIGETLSAAIWADPVPAGIPDDLREPLSSALARTAELVRAWNDRAGIANAMGEAEGALEKLNEAQHEQPPSDPATEALSSVVFTLRRMLAVIRQRTDPPSA